MTFAEHTLQRRVHFSSLWTVEDLIYAEFGPLLNTTTHHHAFDDHYQLLNASYATALPSAVEAIRPHLSNFWSAPPKDFEELYERVRLIIEPIKGIGRLAIYDTAIHIGCNLLPRIIPERYVYLTCDKVEDSAMILLDTTKYSIKNHRIEASAFSSIIPHYGAMEIEDVLCLYHEMIKKFGKFEIQWLYAIP